MRLWSLEHHRIGCSRPEEIDICIYFSLNGILVLLSILHYGVLKDMRVVALSCFLS